MTKVDWMSCVKFTVFVEYYMDGTIKDTGPIARRFIGQPIGNLIKWMQLIGGFRYEHLK